MTSLYPAKFSPFSSGLSPFDADVEKCSTEPGGQENWSLIMNICDRISAADNGPKDGLKSILKQLNSSSTSAACKALSLLNACVNNCGHKFHVMLASPEVLTEFRAILQNPKTPSKVSQQLRSQLKQWSEMKEVKFDKELSGLVNLSREPVSVSSSVTASGISLPNATPAAAAAREQQELNLAIQLSLQETDPRRAGGSSGALNSGLSTQLTVAPSAAPMTSLALQQTGGALRAVRRTVKALYDFEAAEDNELSFRAGDLVAVTDDSDVNWWRGRVPASSRPAFDGLFPASFVTGDLSAVVESSSSASASAGVAQQQSASAAAVAVEPAGPVAPEKARIERCLELLNNEDPTDVASPHPEELDRLESLVARMETTVECEMSAVDAWAAELHALDEAYRHAMQLYAQAIEAQQQQQQQQLAAKFSYPSPMSAPSVSAYAPPETYYAQAVAAVAGGIPPMASAPAPMQQLYAGLSTAAGGYSLPPQAVDASGSQYPVPFPSGSSAWLAPAANAPTVAPASAFQQAPTAAPHSYNPYTSLPPSAGAQPYAPLQ